MFSGTLFHCDSVGGDGVEQSFLIASNVAAAISSVGEVVSTASSGASEVGGVFRVGGNFCWGTRVQKFYKLSPMTQVDL